MVYTCEPGLTIRLDGVWHTLSCTTVVWLLFLIVTRDGLPEFTHFIKRHQTPATQAHHGYVIQSKPQGPYPHMLAQI